MKKAILFCALIALSLTVNTASAEECYLELRGGIGAWKGPCKDGEAYGTGFATFPNGTYAGSAKDGRAHGWGKWRLANGLYLEGEFRNGDVHGRHAGKDAHGNPIVAELQMGEDGKHHLIFLRDDRQARQEEASQEAASGESRPEDAGEAKAAAGEAAATGATGGGEPARQVEAAAPGPSDSPVVEANPTGDAAATAPARAAPAARECRLEIGGESLDWSGQCKDGKAHGNGLATASDGMIYDGNAKDGKPHGHGTLTSASGQMLYQGDYRDGVRHGRGTFLGNDGRYYVAYFEYGWQVGEEIPVHGFASDESRPEDAAQGLDGEGDWQENTKYDAAVRALDGGDGVIRAAIPDDDYDAKLTELDKSEALEIEAWAHEKAMEAERRSEAIKAGIRKEEAAKDAEKMQSREALNQEAKEYWERELGSSGTRRPRKSSFGDRLNQSIKNTIKWMKEKREQHKQKKLEQKRKRQQKKLEQKRKQQQREARERAKRRTQNRQQAIAPPPAIRIPDPEIILPGSRRRCCKSGTPCTVLRPDLPRC